MNLHEYQAKSLFAQYGLPVSEGYAVDTADEAVEAAQKIGGDRWVVKVQVHAGGRGKAGGVKLADSLDDIRAFADQWIGKNLVTIQTDENGQPVSKIYVESCTDIDRELYLSAVIDRGSRRVVFMASTEGGVEIEQVAEETSEGVPAATTELQRQRDVLLKKCRAIADANVHVNAERSLDFKRSLHFVIKICFIMKNMKIMQLIQLHSFKNEKLCS